MTGPPQHAIPVTFPSLARCLLQSGEELIIVKRSLDARAASQDTVVQFSCSPMTNQKAMKNYNINSLAKYLT